MRAELISAIRQGDFRVRLAAVLGLGASLPEDAPMPPDLGEVFVAACSDAEEGVRAFAALALAEKGDRRGFDTLVSALSADNGEIVGAGIVGLKKLGDPAALPAIRARLDAESDKTSEIARELVHARNDLKSQEKKLAKQAG